MPRTQSILLLTAFTSTTTFSTQFHAHDPSAAPLPEPHEPAPVPESHEPAPVAEQVEIRSSGTATCCPRFLTLHVGGIALTSHSFLAGAYRLEAGIQREGRPVYKKATCLQEGDTSCSATGQPIYTQYLFYYGSGPWGTWIVGPDYTSLGAWAHSDWATPTSCPTEQRSWKYWNHPYGWFPSVFSYQSASYSTIRVESSSDSLCYDPVGWTVTAPLPCPASYTTACATECQKTCRVGDSVKWTDENGLNHLIKGETTCSGSCTTTCWDVSTGKDCGFTVIYGSGNAGGASVFWAPAQFAH